ncbi:hypothetical protein SAMN04487766_103166 [Actinomyces ruminicola]|uniref:Uncharacterized protein n=1 Tax=Actinomyces ruminicola TaxID=332524 RepID=A0A1G9TVX8_9ACTO|nr:hypothetical protein SAMN04487766_103166 [Actinomyces ruminicola]
MWCPPVGAMRLGRPGTPSVSVPALSARQAVHDAGPTPRTRLSRPGRPPGKRPRGLPSVLTGYPACSTIPPVVSTPRGACPEHPRRLRSPSHNPLHDQPPTGRAPKLVKTRTCVDGADSGPARRGLGLGSGRAASRPRMWRVRRRPGLADDGDAPPPRLHSPPQAPTRPSPASLRKNRASAHVGALSRTGRDSPSQLRIKRPDPAMPERASEVVPRCGPRHAGVSAGGAASSS